MKEIFLQYGVQIFTGVMAVFVSMVGWVIKEYYSTQKKTDEKTIEMINGLGKRLNESLTEVKKDIQLSKTELKLDIKEIGKRVDEAVILLHDVEKRIIISGYEEELKRLQEIKSKVDV
jgi:hypothetical protein